jgi:hypothetical protein
MAANVFFNILAAISRMGGDLHDSLSSLQAIRHCYTNPGTHGPQHDHHHMLLLSGITSLLKERRRQGFSTTLQKIRAHTHIRGNNLADAAAKLAVTQHHTLTESQKLKVIVGDVALRPSYWVVYTAKPPSPPPVRDGYKNGYATLTVVVNYRREETPDACFHERIQTSPT